MQGNRKNGWIVVTGATGGIGNALVSRLAAQGQNVIAAAREPHRISATPGPGRVVGVRLVREYPSMMTEVAGEIARTIGGDWLSGLVNVAGVIAEGPLEVIPPAELRRQFDIKLTGPFALTQGLLPLLKQARGKILNIGAISAHLTIPFYGAMARVKICAGLAQ